MQRGVSIGSRLHFVLISCAMREISWELQARKGNKRALQAPRTGGKAVMVVKDPPRTSSVLSISKEGASSLILVLLGSTTQLGLEKVRANPKHHPKPSPRAKVMVKVKRGK